ncbi:MAG: ribose-5-phosphate isomerase RpiA [Bacteroidota bacterium]
MAITNPDNEKKRAAQEALKYVNTGMVLGLGTGSTAKHMIRGLGAMVSQGLQVKGVPSSERTANLAKELGIPLTTLELAPQLDLTIDGADEFDPKLRLIKGGGGALLREKILAHNSKMNIIITDSSKAVRQLGKFKLPLEIIPFALQSILVELQEMELRPVLRRSSKGIFTTDENNYILDISVYEWDNLNELNRQLIAIPGIVETGLFLETTDLLIMGKGNSVVELQK